MESRKHTRHLVEYVGSFSGERINAPGIIVDLSSAGCRARSAAEFNHGEYLKVLIDIPRYENPLHIPLAVVRWSRAQEFGMEFIQMEQDDHRRLREVIRQTEAAMALRMEHRVSVRPN
jgi:PilZ domain